MVNNKNESEYLINSSNSKNLKIENDAKDSDHSEIQEKSITTNEIIVKIEDDNTEVNLNKKIKNKTENEDKNLLVNFFKQFILLRVYLTALSAYFAIIFIDIVNYVIQYVLFKNNNVNSNQVAVVEEMKKNILFVLIYGNIISPIVEELICRRLIFYFINKYSKILAYLISCFIFAFGHFQFSFKILLDEFNYFPLYFISGVIYAYAYDYDGYILASIYAHIMINFTSFFLILFS